MTSKEGPRKRLASERLVMLLQNEESLGARLRLLRESEALTQETLCGALRVSVGQMSRWENDEQVPNSVNLHALARHYGVDISLLTIGEEASEGYAEGGLDPETTTSSSQHSKVGKIAVERGRQSGPSDESSSRPLITKSTQGLRKQRATRTASSDGHDREGTQNDINDKELVTVNITLHPQYSVGKYMTERLRKVAIGFGDVDRMTKLDSQNVKIQLYVIPGKGLVQHMRMLELDLERLPGVQKVTANP